MKKRWLLLTALAFGTGLPLTAHADAAVSVYMKDEKVAFEKPPVIENGITMVPFRELMEKIGLIVDYVGAEHKITGSRLGTRVELKLGSASAVVNGQAKQLAAAPPLIGGSAYVPLRFVGEAADYSVSWETATRSVTLRPTKASLVLDRLGRSHSVFQPSGSGAAGGKWAAGDGTAVYEGGWQNGCPQGDGVFAAADMFRYAGQWKNCRFDGIGKLDWKDGRTEYEGGFNQGLRHGKGKYYNPGGGLLYEGDFAEDKMEGWGRFYSASGHVVYEGEVREGVQEGTGKLIYETGKLNYEGQFAGGKPEGTGKLYDERGAVVYDGAFRQGVPVAPLTASASSEAAAHRAWKSFETGHFVIRYNRNDDRIKEIAAHFDNIYNTAFERYRHAPVLAEIDQKSGKIPVYLLAGDQFTQELGASYDNVMGQWNAGKLYMKVKSLEQADRDMPFRILRHELIHAMTLSAEESAACSIPAWFSEGAAAFHDFDPPYDGSDNVREEAVRRAVTENRLLPWSKLAENPSLWGKDDVLLGYGQAWSIWQFLSSVYGEDKMVQLFYKSGDMAVLLEEATGKSESLLEADWLSYVKTKYAGS